MRRHSVGTVRPDRAGNVLALTAVALSLMLHSSSARQEPCPDIPVTNIGISQRTVWYHFAWAPNTAIPRAAVSNITKAFEQATRELGGGGPLNFRLAVTDEQKEAASRDGIVITNGPLVRTATGGEAAVSNLGRIPTPDPATGLRFIQNATITYDFANDKVYNTREPGLDSYIKKVTLHEIGHVMGLGDWKDKPDWGNKTCADEPDGKTIINNACSLHDINRNMPDAFTDCDKAKMIRGPVGVSCCGGDSISSGGMDGGSSGPFTGPIGGGGESCWAMVPTAQDCLAICTGNLSYHHPDNCGGSWGDWCLYFFRDSFPEGLVDCSVTVVIRATADMDLELVPTVDAPGAPPAITIDDITLSEGNGTGNAAVFTVWLSAPSDVPVTIQYITEPLTANAGSDYVTTTGTVQFDPGVTTRTISVPIVADFSPEGSESFNVLLASAVNASITDPKGTATITDDDPVELTVIADREFPIPAGRSITFSAIGGFGAPPYEHQFWLYSAAVGGWRIVQNWSESNSFSWTPAAADTYKIEVRRRTQGSTAPYDDYKQTELFVIDPPIPPSIPAFWMSSGTLAAGAESTWYAVGVLGAGPLQYIFWVLDPQMGWYVAQDYSPTQAFTWRPLTAGTYAIQVWVRSANSTAIYDAWAGTGLFTVHDTAAVDMHSLSANRQLPVAQNTVVTWTAEASGPSIAPLQYQYWLLNTATGTWTMPRDYSADPVWSWTPNAPGTYAVQAWVRAVGSSNAYDDWISSGTFSVSSSPASGVTISCNQAFPLAAPAPITWHAKGIGGTAPLEYQFWIQDVTTGNWTILRDWSTSDTVTWTPSVSDFGVKTVQVWTRSTGSIAAYEAWASTGYFLITR